MNCRLIASVSAAFVAVATTGLIPSFAATPSTSYTVQSGDTLYKIAVGHGDTLASVEAANPQVANFSNIFPGQTIYLPTGQTSSNTGQTGLSSQKTYVVRPIDTMYKIAVAEGVSLSALESANPSVTDFGNLTIGQSLTIPSAVSSSVPSTAATVSSSSQRADSIIASAESFIGVPYCWGGSSPSTGFDCSGFVQYVYGLHGIVLPRESHTQATVGSVVSQANLLPGDLLFFSNTDQYASLYANQVTHVGIYIGNGAMIESSSSNNNEGIVTVKNVFSNPYYSSHYYGARRVIN